MQDKARVMNTCCIRTDKLGDMHMFAETWRNAVIVVSRTVEVT
jgi:hypothetical protein